MLISNFDERLTVFYREHLRTGKIFYAALNIVAVHHTSLDEHFLRGPREVHENVDEMQTDLDDYLARYNTKQPYQGRDMKGRTPYPMFVKGLHKEKKTVAKTAAQTEKMNLPVKRRPSGNNHHRKEKPVHQRPH
tara:strand:- start:8908 stop:9309 length:402 start_codon:yes stop_codon:yes gene_type:complete